MKKLGRYEILDELNRDNYTTIYRARDTLTDREVALKVLPSPETQQPALVELFKENAQAAINLRHPHIATAYDFGDDEGTLYLAMRLVGGQTLRQFLNQHKPLTLGKALPILTQLAEALDYADEQGMVYEVLDAADVIIEDENGSASVTITDLGMPFEHVEEHEQNFLPHVFALAALAVEMLTGRPPVKGKLIAQPESISSETPSSELNSTYAFSGVETDPILSDLAQLPTGQYTSAGALVAALRSQNDRIIERSQLASEVMQILALAQAVRKAGDWLRVQSLALQVAHDERSHGGDRSHNDALNMIAEAAAAMYRVETKRKHLDNLFEKGEQALRKQDWESALASFEKLARIDPDYPEVNEKLIQASAERKRARLFNQAMEQNSKGELTKAYHSWLTLLDEQWDYRQGDAVQYFMAVTEQLLDQNVQDQHKHQDEDISGQHNLTATQHAQLLQQQTEELEPGIDQESKMPTISIDDPQIDTDWLETLPTRQTEKLEPGSDQEPKTPTRSIDDPEIDDWLEKLSSQQTEQLEPKSGSAAKQQNKVRGTRNIPGASEIDASWLDKLSSQQSDRLVRHLTKAGKQPKRETEIKRTVWNLDGKEMMRIPSGEFFYGTDKRIVNLDEFWIDKTPITNLEYNRFLEANPDHPVPFSGSEDARPYSWDPRTRTFPKGKADHPVVLVNLHDVQAYAYWVGKLLPTEQQWEKAARGTDGRKYPWGGIWRDRACNTSDIGLGETTAAGKFSPIGDSPYGCVDMSGNVWEWTASNFSETTIVLRGGSWRNGRFDVWCTLRSRSLADTSAIHTGFRLILPTIVPG